MKWSITVNMRRLKLIGALLLLVVSALTLPLSTLAAALTLLPFVFGAVSIATVRRTPDEYTFDVTSTADGDTVSASLPHGMGVIPEVSMIQILSQALTAMSNWAVTTIDKTNLVLTKLTSTGSGNAGAQLRVTVRRPR